MSNRKYSIRLPDESLSGSFCISRRVLCVSGREIRISGRILRNSRRVLRNLRQILRMLAGIATSGDGSGTFAHF